MTTPQQEPTPPASGNPAYDTLAATLKEATVARRAAHEGDVNKRDVAFGRIEAQAILLNSELTIANATNVLVAAAREYVTTLPARHIELLPSAGTPDAELKVPDGLKALVICPDGIAIKVTPKGYSAAEQAQRFAENAVSGAQKAFFGSVLPAVERMVGPLTIFGVSQPAAAQDAEAAAPPEYIFRAPTVTDLRYFPYRFEDVMDAVVEKCKPQ